MKFITLIENSSLKLLSEYVEDAIGLLKENPSLPFMINNDTLIFDKYIIGSIQFKDLVITIKPRIKKMTTNSYLEMQLYNEGLLDERISSLLDENQSYGIQESIISLFIEETLNLVNKGLDGDFIIVREETNFVKGKIIVDQISPVNLMLDRVPVEYEMHTLQTSYNMLVKLALDKVQTLSKSSGIRNKISIVGSFFKDIQADFSDIMDYFDQVDQKLFFVNKHYPTVLALAKKILIDLKINLKNNKVSSSSYLVNSNTIFESYVRKVLNDYLKASVTKWNVPRSMGNLVIDGNEISKSYCPDVLINYRNSENLAYAVIDAKNKDISKRTNVAEVSDIYQLLFYCNSMSARYGILVYPDFEGFDITRLNISSFSEQDLYVCTIDFAYKIQDRHFKFIEQVKKILIID